MIIYENRACTILFNFLKSLGNDKIFLLPSNVCPIVVAAFLKANRKFEFIDISQETLCIDEKEVIEKISNNPSKYAGLLFVRSYGTDDSFEKFFRSIKKINHNLIIIDDRCLSIPSFEDHLGFADIILYSTGYSKYADIGFGAFALLRNGILYNRYLHTFNIDDLDLITEKFKYSIDSRKRFEYEDTDWLITERPAVDFHEYKNIAIENIKKSTELKYKINSIYSNNLPKKIQLDPKFQNWRFNIIVPEKEKLIKKIFNNDLFASSHYFPSSFLFNGEISVNTEYLYSNIINLFNDKYFSLEKAKRIVEIINKHLSEKINC